MNFVNGFMSVINSRWLGELTALSVMLIAVLAVSAIIGRWMMSETR